MCDCPECQWQPISTAPEGIDPMLVFCEGYSIWPVVARRDPEGGPDWCEVFDGGVIPDPSHWRPLPFPSPGAPK